MKIIPPSVEAFLPPRYKPVVLCFLSGAGLELFMNYFYIGEANIYRSILKNTSTSIAENQFEAERITVESMK